MERKKRSKGRGWESCYVKKIYGTFGVEMRAYGQKLVKFCTHTHTRLSYSSNDSLSSHNQVETDVARQLSSDEIHNLGSVGHIAELARVQDLLFD